MDIKKEGFNLVKINNINGKYSKSKNKYKKFYLIACFILLSYILGFVSHCLINKKNLKQYKEKTMHLLLSNFICHSQTFEDFILFYLFYDINDGFYIDVGANDPVRFSTTKSFYDKGWHGINIEPLPDKYNLLKTFRKRDINLQFGIANKEGNMTLMVKACESSIFYDKNASNLKIININVTTMSIICKKFVPVGTIIQFLKIDVEGAEKFVLLGIDFVHYRPKVICIESNINKETNTPAYKEWEDILIKNDYNFAYEYFVNRFYYDNRKKGLKERFDRIDYFVNAYKKKFGFSV